MSEPTLTVLFAERIGALDRIVSLLRRRGFPISGMSLERTHRSDVRRMSVGVHQVSALPQVQRHLARLPDVLEVTVTDGEALHREYALLRVRCIAAERGEILAILAAFDARALSFSESHVVVEATGFTQQIEALFTALSAYGIEESARTNPIALRRMSGTADSEHARQSA